MTTWLHQQRLGAVLAEMRCQAPDRWAVIDLGCGDGDLFVHLAREPGLARLVGIDLCAVSLARLRQRLRAQPNTVPEIDLRCGSMTEADASLSGFDCALLIETIEHLDPARLPQLERAVFGQMQPALVIATTPNAEFNPLLGVPPHRYRHPDHRFEWPRARFRQWAGHVARRHGYEACCRDIAGAHPILGGASQMAIFHRRPRLPRDGGRRLDPSQGADPPVRP